MKEFYNEYFHIPKHGKIREKVMLVRVAITAFIMVFCLAAISLTAYAYFSYNVTSDSNIIKAANFEADVIINITTETGALIPVTEESNHKKTALLKAGNTYHVVLDESASSTAGTGFIIVSSPACQEVYHTQQLGDDESVEGGRTEKIIFDLSVTADTTVCFVSHWGTSSHYDDFKNKGDGGKLYITNANTGDNAVKMVINGVINSISESDVEKETTSNETTATETTPTEVVYTVQSGDTLSKIAEQYNTTVARIVAYNGLANPDDIRSGQQLKIPSADYEVPADTTEQTTTKQETTTTTETTAPETTTPETTTSAETTTPPETSVTDPVDTTAPAETTTSTETTGTSETSAPAETTESVETTSDETEATETTAASTNNAE